MQNRSIIHSLFSVIHLIFKFCHTCFSYHSTRDRCYVQPIEPKDKKYYLVFFDFECTTHLPVLESLDDEEPTSRFHSVNCVSAMLFCSKCTKDVDLEDIHADLSIDSNCLCRSKAMPERRMITWINGVDNCPDALDAFLTWLFTGIAGGTDRPHTTYVFGHYCGR